MAIEVCKCTKHDSGWTQDGNLWVCGACRKPSYASVWGPYPEPQVPTGRRYILTQTELIPLKFRNYLCTCIRDNKVPSDFATRWHHDKHYATCYRCGKMTADRLYDCEVDGRTFVKDFNHLAFCRNHPRCWEHLDHDLETPICGDRPTDWTWSEDCPQAPWTTLNAPPVDITDFDPFASIFS